MSTYREVLIFFGGKEMAKKSFSISFTKCELYFENNDVVVVERNKDEEKTYNFLEVVRSLEGVEGLSIKISHDNEIPTE